MIKSKLVPLLVLALALTGCGGAAPSAVPSAEPSAPVVAEPKLGPTPDFTLIRGKIQAVEPAGYQVRADPAVQRIATGPKTGYALLAPAALDSIKQGEYVGVAAATQPDGSIRAIDVHIFPESARGEGEGYYPWDFPGPGLTSMTNGTVTDTVAQVQGSKLTLGAKGQSVVIDVPPDTKVVRVQPATAADVVRPGYGTLSVCRKGADGSLTAQKVFAGVGGAMPPF